MQRHTWSTWAPLGPCPGGRTPPVEVDHTSQVLSSEPLRYNSQLPEAPGGCKDISVVRIH